MTAIKESALVRRAQQGDRDAYGALAAQYSGSLLGIAYSGVKNFTAAEDIAQDALLLAFENLAKLKRPAKFGGWIRTIARNLCFQWRKNAAYRRELEHENGALRARLGYDNAPTPLAMLEAEERHGQLRRALEALPDLEREALLAFYFEGQRMEIAAAGAGISTAAMRKRVQRGRDRLREVLNAELDAALVDAGRREGRTALLLAALASGAVYSRAGAESIVPAGGFAIPATGIAGITVVIVLAFAVSIFSADRKAQTTYTHPDSATLAADYSSQSLDETRRQANGDAVLANAQAGIAESEVDIDAPYEEEHTAILSGRVTDTRGNPVPDAEVEAIASDEVYVPSRRDRNVVSNTVTDADGLFRLEGLGENIVFRLRVFHPDWAVHASSVRIEDYAETSFDIQFLEPDVLHGTVADTKGGAIAGAVVSLLAIRSPAEMTDAFANNSGSDGVYGALLETESDESGRFQLTNLPKGWVLAGIVAKKPGYAIDVARSEAGARTAKLQYAKSLFTAWNEHCFPAPWEQANISLKQGGTVSGTVFDESGDRPAAGATVRIRGSIRKGTLYYSEETQADAAGRYEVNDLPEGGLQPIVATKGAATSPYAIHYIASGGKLSQNLRLAPGGSITGAVIDTNSEQPISHTVIQFSQDGTTGNRRTVTDRGGHFVIQNLPPGPWFVQLADSRFHDPNAYAKIDLKFPGTRANTTIYADPSLPAISQAERLGKLGKINGTAFNASGGQGGKVQVWLQSRGTTPINTDAHSGFVIENVMPGQDVLHAIDPVNYRYGRSNISMREGRVEALAVKLDKNAGRAAGSVLDSAGKALGISVPVEFALEGMSTIVDADTLGRFDTGAIPPGSYTARANVDDLQGLRAEEPIVLDLQPGAYIENLPLVVNRMAGSVSGRVTDAAGTPLADIPVRIHGVSVSNLQTVTDTEGRYTIEPLDADEALITAGNPPKGGKGGEKPWAVVRRTDVNDRPQDLTLFKPGQLKVSLDFPEHLEKRPGMNIMGELGYLGGLDVESGEYEFHLQPDRYHITMFDDSRKILDERIQVRSGELTDLGRIAPYGDVGSVLVEISYNGGPPESSLGEFTVMLDPVRKGVAKHTLERNADGDYRLGTVTPDEYRAVVLLQRGDGQQRVEQQRVMVEAERETYVVFNLVGGDTDISGNVSLTGSEEAAVWLFDGEMTEPSPGTVFQSRETTRARARAVVDEDGAYHLDGASPRRYLLVLTKSVGDDNVVAASRLVDLAEGVPLVWDGASQGTETLHN